MNERFVATCRVARRRMGIGMKTYLLVVMLVSSVCSANEPLQPLFPVPPDKAVDISSRNREQIENLQAISKSTSAFLYETTIAALMAENVRIWITLPEEYEPIEILGEGISWHDDRSGIWRGRVLSPSPERAVFATSDGETNVLTLHVTRWVYDENAKRFFVYPIHYDPAEISDWKPGNHVLSPFPIGAGISLAYTITGDWILHSSELGTRAFRFLPMEHDRDILMIVPLDPQKTWDAAD